MRNNNQVTSEGYFATTANAGSSLVASYIKKGITVGGITGTLETLDTSDATATPEDIALGKTAYVDGVKITGTRAEPTGRVNTERMIASWNSSQYGEQNDNSTYDDMWGVIQDEVAEGWFVPSKSEWAAFGATFDITSSNYSTFGLRDIYWSSSQNGTGSIYDALFATSNINYSMVYSIDFVRLATIF